MYLVDGTEKYRDAYLEAIEHLNFKYRNFVWEGQSCDRYADVIENGLNLYDQEPDTSLKDWIDSEIKVMCNMQKNSGIVSGVCPDGNFTQTRIRYGLWKTQGTHYRPWREDLKFGAKTKGEELLIYTKANRPWKDKLTSDRQKIKRY